MDNKWIRTTNKIRKTKIKRLYYIVNMTKHKDKNKMTNNANLHVTTVTQSSNEDLGRKENILYYLVIVTDKGKTVINVGKKTHDNIKYLTTDEKGSKK